MTARWIGLSGSILGGLPLRAIVFDLRITCGVVTCVVDHTDVSEECVVDGVAQVGDVVAQTGPAASLDK
jgi:hypothetical protein